MPVESEADRAVFVNPDEFGSAALYTVEGGAAITIAVLFDRPSERLFDAPGLSSQQARITVRAADLPAGYGEGDAVTIDGTAYIVRVPEPDGLGMVRMMLEEA